MWTGQLGLRDTEGALASALPRGVRVSCSVSAARLLPGLPNEAAAGVDTGDPCGLPAAQWGILGILSKNIEELIFLVILRQTVLV